MNWAELPEFLERLARQDAGKAELQNFSQWLAALNDKEYGEVLHSYQNVVYRTGSVKSPPDLEGIRERMEARLNTLHHPAPRISLLRMEWFRYAAILLILAGTAIYLYNYSGGGEASVLGSQVNQNEQPDIAPGGNKAILTLADGRKILLDSAGIGSLAQQGSTKVLKLDAGKLAYEQGQAGGEVLYNTISTPIGGQYQVILPDGTGVWLNAASSITFPTSFPGNSRSVEIKGEGYFEIAENSKKPFLVSFNGTQVLVLGTSFNVNAYGDDGALRTTLVDGSVKIIRNGKQTILRPGQQAVTGSDFPEIRVLPARLEDVIAWKKGLFKFNEMSVEAIMLQLARWYDLELNYQGKVSKGIYATIPRNVPVSEVLQLLEQTGAVHFKLNGRKLLITP